MDKIKALQKLLDGSATKKEIEMLRQALANGEISIGGDVNRSVVIIGSGNKVELTAEALGILKPEKKTEEPVEGEPPYMGLRYFDTSDVDLFYGREALTRELMVRVQKESFLAIVGASGSGKSSVARAGLIPAWKKENERGVVRIITPTAHPLESLAASLTYESESITATSTLMDDLMKDSRSLRLFVKKTWGETKMLLLVDQFEETFTLCKDLDERKAFIENLLLLSDIAANSDAHVVLTLRADFYHHCAEYEGLRLALETHQAYIGAMINEELREAITLPAQKNGWNLQPGLVDLILQDVGIEPGALPLLSHALLETWKRRSGYTMTLQGYHEAGGVRQAIAQTAESVYDRLTLAEQTIARGIFLRLVEFGDGIQSTRRRVKPTELLHEATTPNSVANVLKTLADARLVTTEQDGVEITHEALILHWEKLRNWSDDNRRFLIWRQKIIDRYMDWQINKGELLQGSYLDEAENWLLEEESQFSVGEKKYIEESIKYRNNRRKVLSNVNFGFLISYIFLAIIVGIIGVYTTTRQAAGTLTERLTNQLLEAGRTVSDSFIRQEKSHVSEARRITFTTGLAQALADEDPEAVAELAEPAFEAGTIENLILISASGNEIIHLLRDDNGKTVKVEQDTHAVDLPIVSEFFKSKNPSDPPRRCFGANLINNKTYYYTSLPVSLDNRFYGVVLVGTSVQTLLPIIERVALADIVLYGNNGQAIATTLGQADAETLEFLSISEDQYRSIIISEGFVSGENFRLTERDYTLGRSRLQVGNDVIGVFAVTLPSDYVLEFRENTRQTYTSLFIAIAIIVIMIGIVVARRVIAPLYNFERPNQVVSKKMNRKTRDWLILIAILPTGILLILIAGQIAVRIMPDWVINTSMESNLILEEDSPNDIGLLQPLLPQILTPIPWADTFLTPNLDGNNNYSDFAIGSLTPLAIPTTATLLDTQWLEYFPFTIETAFSPPP